MITRIARNDVVRLLRTGEVGTVEGWADHAKIDGTVIDVRLSSEKVITGNALAFEFVAHAKPPQTTARTVWSIVALFLSAAGGAWAGYSLHNWGVPMFSSVFHGVVGAWLWLVLFGYYSRPRKTRVTQPRVAPSMPRQSKSVRPVTK